MDAVRAADAGPLPDRVILRVVSAYAAAFVVFGLVVDGPDRVLQGLVDIVLTRDALLTDYFGIGGIGAGCVNAGLLTLGACLVYRLAEAKITGASVACLFLVLGFGLFGKNLLNIWSIVLGVFLYARFRGEPFSAHVNTAFFGAALAPVFSEILFSTVAGARVPGAARGGTSLVIGFILAPAAAQLFRAHMGFSLYNMGFTAGIVGTLVVAMYKSYGFVPDPVMIWTTGNNALLGGFLAALFASMVALGFHFDRALPSRLKRILAEAGQAPTDFIAIAGFGPTLANMGLAGAVGTLYVLAVGGDLNGPVIGAILTIVGFAAFGKHPRNIVPIMAGVFLGSLFKPFGAADPSILLAALFGTTLAPIAGRFGWHWGVVAGLVHSSAALSVGSLHAGLNLYNNGFAAGLVASVLVPVIIAITGKRGAASRPARVARLAPTRAGPGARASLAGRLGGGLVQGSRGSRNIHVTSTNGPVSAGMASGVSATLNAACATTVNTVPSAAYAATRRPGWLNTVPSATAVSTGLKPSRPPVIRSLSAPSRCAVTTARIAPPSAATAAATELTASPARKSSAATALPFRNTCEMLSSVACTNRPSVEPRRRDRLERRDHARGGQRAAGEPREPVGREQQQPGDEHERERQRRHAPGPGHVGGGRHRDDRHRGAQHHVGPEQRTRRDERGERQADEQAVEAVEAGAQRCLVDAQPLRRQRRRDDREQAAEQDLRHAGGERPPGDGGEEQRAAQRIVLEHHLPDRRAG